MPRLTVTVTFLAGCAAVPTTAVSLTPDTVSYTHLDVYKRQVLGKVTPNPAAAAETVKLHDVVVVVPGTCLLYTSRCV